MLKKEKCGLIGLQQALDKENIDLNIYLGNEIYFSENIVNLIKEGKAATLNISNYVLFEIPLNVKPLNIYDVVYDIMSNNMIPILAHPERYSAVQNDPNFVYELIQTGVLMQSNYGSILGRYGEKAKIILEKLLKNNMIHFLGSDVHRPGTVYPNIKEALIEIEKIIGKNKLDELTTINPRAIIDNIKIEIDEPREIELSLKDKIKLKYKK